MSQGYDQDQISKFLIGIIAFAIFAILLGVGVQLCFLHIWNHSTVEPERSFSAEVLACRGRIFDRNGGTEAGVPLAETLPAKLVFLDPQDERFNQRKRTIPREYVAEELGRILQMPASEILTQLQRTDSRYIKLTTTIDDDVIEELKTRSSLKAKDKFLPGVNMDPSFIRRYPLGGLMSHVVGFVNKEGVGSAGIEQSFNTELKGVPGKISGKVNARQEELRNLRYEDVPAIPGVDVYLTLDMNIQASAERELRIAAEKYKATAGFVIVQRVKTGEILAMASYPEYNPNEYSKSTDEERQNKAMAISYEPGSTLKAVTVAAALNEGLVTPETTYDVGNGTWPYGGFILRDHVKGHIDITTAVKKSSNIVCAQLSLVLGKERMWNYLRAFGFGTPYGVSLPGEAKGLMRPAKEWANVDATRIAIGQGVAVSGLQLLNAYCTIANGGKLMRPYLIDRVVGADGKVMKQNTPEVIGRPIRAATAAQMRTMLEGVTEEGGTATRATVKNYTTAGKTGTAQIYLVDQHRYSQSEYHASFVGYFPATAPEVAILVVIERPQPQHYGGVVAAPVFARVAEDTATYLSIQPDALE